ncbi:MAG: hypothetical protein ACREGC_01165, partial [Minisyncoccia bacterium]
MADHEENSKKRPLSSRDKDDIKVNELARKIASEPRTTKDALKDIPVTPGNYKKFQGEEKKELPKGIWWGILGVVVVFVGGFIASYYIAKERVVREISSEVSILKHGVNDLQNLDPQSAAVQFQNLGSTPDLGGLVGALGFLFKGGVSAFHSFSDL